ncbi:MULTISPECIES: toprim domain-containing protein [unclassified Methylobacterium]|uniref:DUF7146 domain-containing protein n=1 Tax=unclassified Methylobacterium TaxID=2615210 RepID=UPI00226980EF|nr:MULTISPECIES: toprim domain-containing protein [unclassified Methylobacterium]
MIDLRSAAHALGGEVSGRGVLCPGPGHSSRDRSLSVLFDASAPGGFTLHSHCGDDFAACRDYVRARLGLSAQLEPKRIEASFRQVVGNSSDRTTLALRIWREAQPAVRSPVERHLASRGLGLPEAGADVLRYHDACAFGDDRAPVMVAALRCIHTDRLQAVHRTALTPAGEKIGRKMLGPAAGAAVKLDPDDAVTLLLAIGEGIETCLAARLLGIRPAWALGSVGAIRVFPVLSGIEALTILVESDDGGASEAAAKVCAARWHAAGREVILARPRVPGDMNDAIREARRL